MTAYSNEVVTEAYRKYLRRAPDVEGFAYWVGKVNEQLSAGKKASDVETFLKDFFTDSPEYKSLTSA